MAGQPRPQPGLSLRSATSVTSNNTRQQQQQASLAKRLLFPHLPPGSELPSLFVSPVCPPELNDEVYDFIALALRAFVNIWWTKITRYDKEFLPQIASIVTRVVRALEERILNADLSLLVFCDIPAIVTQHYLDYRHVAAKVSTSYAASGALSLPQLFHQLQPHMAISSDGTIDEEYFRQAFDHVLKACLPPEDYAPEAERFIIREIVLKVVVKDVIPRQTEPWFLQKTMLDLLGPYTDVIPDKVPSMCPSASHTYSHFSKSSIIVLFLSAIQTLSGACLVLIHAYKQTITTITLVNKSNFSRPTPRTRSARSQLDLLPTTPSTSSRDSSVSPISSTKSSTASQYATTSQSNLGQTTIRGPDLVRGPLVMISAMLNVQERLATTALFQTIFMFCSFLQSFMNKLLSHFLYTRVLSASSMLSIVRLSKRTLFPNGYPGPPPIDPTPEEQIIIREQLIKRIAERFPTLASLALLGPSPITSLDAIVDPLSNSVCNTHLAVFLFDALLLTIFPEMGVGGANADDAMDGSGLVEKADEEDNNAHL
ncbi:PXA domain-containing protein [Melanogaster broomeanus]|nr:PXA domain-containing protein [Melanogaster broomeanus]